MQIEAVNRRARERYATFVTAMEMVMHALEETNTLIAKVGKKPGGFGWTVATKAELRGIRRGAFEELERLRTKTKKYEADLKSRDWRL
jgi:adenylosuccinate synthase